MYVHYHHPIAATIFCFARYENVQNISICITYCLFCKVCKQRARWQWPKFGHVKYQSLADTYMLGVQSMVPTIIILQYATYIIFIVLAKNLTICHPYVMMLYYYTVLLHCYTMMC